MRSLRTCVLLLCWSIFSEGNPTVHDSFIQKVIPEGAKVGTTLATVKATASSGSLSYDINTAAKEWFTINSTGTITIIKPPDREASAFVSGGGVLAITVTVSDSSGQDKGTVLCVLTDINDFVPAITNLPAFKNVTEDTKAGSEVYTVAAIDKDQGRNGRITYSIVDGNQEGMFTIDESDGKVTIAKKLNYENTTSYALNISVTDGCVNCSLSNSSTLFITVLDVDDLPANFSQPFYHAKIDKDSSKGNPVITVHAEDMDSDKAPVTYGIHSGTNNGNYFAIDASSGEITVNEPLVQGTYTLVVTAKSTDQPATFAVVQVIVDSTNVTYETSVVENEANILVFDLKVIESHFGMSNATFSIVSGNTVDMFVANNETKYVTVGSTPLDRELKNTYVLLLKASAGGNEGIAKVTVNVLDVNDNKPVFQPAKPSDSVRVREDSGLGTTVMTVQATDKDAGQNGTVLYDISAGNDQGKFSIDNQTGVISLAKTLDRDTTDQYILNTTATDGGSPPLVTSTQVTVNVLDVNDNSPVLRTSNPMEVEISENITPGTAVATVNAKDEDELDNGKVVYSIISGSDGKFVIDNSTGVITTTATLDRETNDAFKLLVRASDSGTYPRSVISHITIKVTDYNDNRPVISPTSYIAVVYVDSSEDSVVTTVKATDKDIGLNGKLTYQIESGNDEKLFYVEQASGIIKTRATFAEKNGAKYIVEIGASDLGQPVMTSTEKASVSVFVASPEKTVVLGADVTPEFALQNREDLAAVLGTLTDGTSFVRSIHPGPNNSALVTFVSVKDEEVMTVDQQKSAIEANHGNTENSKWNIKCCGIAGGEPTTGARKGSGDEGISAIVGTLIFMAVFIGVAGIIMIIILLKRRKTETPRRTVKFNDKPLYYDAEEGTTASSSVDRAKEAQEVGFHVQNDDEGSDTSNEAYQYTNFAYDGTEETHPSRHPLGPLFQEDQDSDDINFETFFPPPPTVPPPAPPDSDSDQDEVLDHSEGDMFQEGQHSVSFTQEEESTDDDIDSQDQEEEHSPSQSIDSSHDLMSQVTPHFEDADSGYDGYGFRRYSMEEKTTEL